eukprot:scaffold4150_cov138-Isochrysis_galbana.AAC.4
MLAILARQVSRIRAKSLSPTRHLNRAWFSPLSMRCLRPCTPPVRLFSVYSLRVQPSIRHPVAERLSVIASISYDTQSSTITYLAANQALRELELATLPTQCIRLERGVQ